MKNKSSLTFCKFLLVCFISIVCIEKVSAQENGIYELTNNNILSKTKIKMSNDRDEFYTLTQKLHTTAYISNNTVKNVNAVNGDSEIKKITFADSKSFSLLNKNNYKNTELIIITLNNVSELNNTLDLTTNENLGKLKYVFIKCYFKCSANQIKAFINTDSNIRVFYINETPS